MAGPTKPPAEAEVRASPHIEARGAAGAPSSQAFGDGACLIRACGAVALPETRAIEQAVIAAATGGRRAIVLDLTGVTDLGAGLLGGILRIRRGLGAIDGRLVLVVDGPPADALISVSVVQVLVDVVATVDEASALLAPGCQGP